MNRSKLLTATALATVMSATAANASNLAINGFYAASISDNDGGGMSHATSTASIYVNYSDTLDNDMGITINYSITTGWTGVDVFIDTGVGTLGLGDGQDSAVDKMDGSPAIGASLNAYGPRFSTAFNDGDASSGASLMYTTPSINGWTAKVSRGMETASAASTAGLCYNSETGDTLAVAAGHECADAFNANYVRATGTAATEGAEPTMSYAVSGSIMGIGLAGGISQIDNKGATADADPSFITASYTLGPVNLGYALYDADGTSEESQMGASTSLMGMTVGVTFAEDDNTVDTDYMHIGAIKSLGLMSYSVEYLETDVNGTDTGDADAWTVTYTVSF